MPPLSAHLRTLAILLGLSSVSRSALASPTSSDPCTGIAGKMFAPPADVLACLKSFPFNETLRQNVMTVVSRVLDFYTYEDYYLDSPPPFQDSTMNIRAQLARINKTRYPTDYDFNHDLFYTLNRLNDGHTIWEPNCYGQYQNVLPAPVVSLEVDGVQSVYVSPNLVDLIGGFPSGYTSYFDSIGYDWKRLAGARVLAIEGQDPYAYAVHIAETQSGNFLDLGVRVNSAFSSYRISGTDYSQRVGDIAGPWFPDLTSLTMRIITVNSTKEETVEIPFLSIYVLDSGSFTNREDYWDLNCAPNSDTNGYDHKIATQSGAVSRVVQTLRKRARAVISDMAGKGTAVLPPESVPTAPSVNGSSGVIKSYILPDNKTGVMFVGSFEPDDYNLFFTDVEAAVTQFQQANLTQLIVDVTNNGGGYICLGLFLHAYLSGTKSLGNIQIPGSQSAIRINPLAQKIIASDIALGLNSSVSYYTPDNYVFLNNTVMPLNYNYMESTTTTHINGKKYSTSSRFSDSCEPFIVDLPEEPVFAPENIVIVGNANCASTCAMFTTLMRERHNTTIAVFGGKPGLHMEFKGMAGNQVMEWVDIDSEIKTANLKDDPLAPPDLIVNANIRHNWRTGYSYFDESKPIPYRAEPPHYQFPYTLDTYSNPQNLWTFVAEKLLRS